jgi:glycosyltransferase involved in cell wall biosynthesis
MELGQQRPEVRIVLVGGEPAQVETCRQRILSMGLGERVILAGRRPTTEMPEWMRLADVLVSPRSEGENTPLKIYSYMLSATPIVATNLPTHTQVLDDSTAFLCEPTPVSLAAEILRALHDTQLAGRIGSRARKLAQEEFSLTAFERKLLAAYEEILGQTRGATSGQAPDSRSVSVVDEPEGRER